MIDKRKITPYIWTSYFEKWKVEKVISPTKYDDYLLLSKERDTEIHEDGKTIPIDMWLLDVANVEFYPDTPAVRKIIKGLQESAAKINDAKKIGEPLSQIWLSMFPDL